MERIVMVGYRPLPGKEEALKGLMKKHWHILHLEGLVSERKPVICQAADGTIIEIFGWKSKEAIEQSHGNEVVQKLWQEYAKVCEYVPVGEVKEITGLFSEFTPLNF